MNMNGKLHFFVFYTFGIKKKNSLLKVQPSESIDLLAYAELLIVAYCAFIHENHFTHFLFAACLYIEEQAKEMFEKTWLVCILFPQHWPSFRQLTLPLQRQCLRGSLAQGFAGTSPIHIQNLMYLLSSKAVPQTRLSYKILEGQKCIRTCCISTKLQ